MDKEKNKKDNKYLIVGIVAAIILVILAGVLTYVLVFKDKEDDKKIAYTDLIKQITDGEVEKIEMTVGSTSLMVKLKNIEETKNAIVPNTQAFIE